MTNIFAAPAIITTAPTNDVVRPKKKASRLSLAAKFRRSSDVNREDDSTISHPHLQLSNKPSLDERGRPSVSTLEEPAPTSLNRRRTNTGPGPNVTSLLAARQSESSRSDASSVDNVDKSSPSTTPKKTPTSSIFRLRRVKKPDTFFPIDHLPQKGKTFGGTSASSLSAASARRPASSRSAGTPRAQLKRHDSGLGPGNSPVAAAFGVNGAPSGQSSPTRTSIARGRSSTLSSIGRDSNDDFLAPPTTRTSTSTGRKSFGDLLGINRLRQNSELSRHGTFTPATPGSITSKNNSLQINREANIVLPERREDESAVKYLERLEDIMTRGVIAAALSKNTDTFFSTVLRSYMRQFSFFGDPMDMALRKLLMEAELPKETQQIDRFLQAFANRYHECNPGIYSSPDQAYFIAFSLLILHTDVFNRNNKYKMQKTDYIKNTRGEGIADDILECFYDNISYTPFIHVEDDIEQSMELIPGGKPKKKSTGHNGDPAKRAMKEPIDPYTLILEGNLEALRPNLKDAMFLDDHFNYMGSATGLNMKDLQKTFFRTGVLQIVSARSRPDAFMHEKTATNPQEAQAGIVDIKVTKVGLLWRKDAKKRKTRSPWQEWGAVLTGAQLYFFRNTSWVKNLMHQYDSHVKAGHDGIPLIFKPPLEEFKPDALMSTHGAVALMDTTYKKHKNAFVYVRQGGLDEVLLADDEGELNDWLAKLNYAAAFRTTGVRMRGLVGGNYDGQGRRGIRRLDSSDNTHTINTPTGPVSIARSKIDHKMVEDIQIARRDIMREKIGQSQSKVEESQKQLEEQLRNARHLQILAPIQPRTREHLLSAAARMSAQLKWTRMEIWKEKCHLDILAKDLLDELPEEDLDDLKTPTKLTLNSADSTPRATTSRADSKSKLHGGDDRSPSTPTEASTGRFASNAAHRDEQDLPSSPSSAQNAAKRESKVSKQASTSSITSSPARLPTSSSTHTKFRGEDRKDDGGSNKARQSDDFDAEERDLLRQAGLLESKLSKEDAERTTVSAGGDSTDQIQVGERDKFERTKVRRSLQRTLRESAGHLSHHRSKRGRDGGADAGVEENKRDSMLSRGSGSFVVHGKKASVINLGTEFQHLSNDEKIAALKQQYQADNAPPSPSQSVSMDDEYLTAPSESAESRSRRESAASASTATAMSFRELHRKYSSAQAARHASASGRLTVPSDGESEMAVSFTEARRSSLPPAGLDPDGEVLASFHQGEEPKTEEREHRRKPSAVKEEEVDSASEAVSDVEDDSDEDTGDDESEAEAGANTDASGEDDK